MGGGGLQEGMMKEATSGSMRSGKWWIGVRGLRN